MANKSLKSALMQLNNKKAESANASEELDFLTSKEGNEIKGGKGLTISTAGGSGTSTGTGTITRPVDGCSGFECPQKFTCDWF